MRPPLAGEDGVPRPPRAPRKDRGARHLDFSPPRPRQTSDLRSRKMVNSCGFRPPRRWQVVTARTENSHGYAEGRRDGSCAGRSRSLVLGYKGESSE